MTDMTPDRMVLEDTWSDLRRHREVPEIDFDRMHAYRLERLKNALRKSGAAVCILVNPISLRYAVDYRNYAPVPVAHPDHLPVRSGRGAARDSRRL